MVLSQLSVKIQIVWGKSEGKTLLSAFDRALIAGGIHNFNLIKLSSVIPQGVVLEEAGTYTGCRRTGDILHVVLSTVSSNCAGALITAGLGWVQNDEGGLFFEACGECGPGECEKEIRTGLQEMMSARGWDGEIKVKLVTHKVEEIANVMVAAVYEHDRRRPSFE